ncbi:MAG: response regulator transcription factor [Caldilineaceae bacterium]
MSNISVLIVDDHALIRQGLHEICERSGGFDVLGEAQNCDEAVALALALNPDIILMDIVMPGASGIETAQRILNKNPDARIIALTVHHQEELMIEAIKVGMRAFLSKNVDVKSFIAAIKAVARGEYLIDPHIALKVLNAMRENGSRKREVDAVESLTENEMAVLRLVAQGVENDMIAEKLSISMYTVANRLRTIYEKLHVHNRTQAVLYALRHDWVSLHEPPL